MTTMVLGEFKVPNFEYAKCTQWTSFYSNELVFKYTFAIIGRMRQHTHLIKYFIAAIIGLHLIAILTATEARLFTKNAREFFIATFGNFLNYIGFLRPIQVAVPLIIFTMVYALLYQVWVELGLNTDDRKILWLERLALTLSAIVLFVYGSYLVLFNLRVEVYFQYNLLAMVYFILVTALYYTWNKLPELRIGLLLLIVLPFVWTPFAIAYGTSHIIYDWSLSWTLVTYTPAILVYSICYYLIHRMEMILDEKGGTRTISMYPDSTISTNSSNSTGLGRDKEYRSTSPS